MNPGIVDSCISHQAALVVMHTRARPKVRLQRVDLYDDVGAVRDVISTVEVLAGRRDLDPAYLLPDEIRHEQEGWKPS